MTWRRKCDALHSYTRFSVNIFRFRHSIFFLKATIATLSTIRDFLHWLDVVPFVIKIIYACASVHHRYQMFF